MDRPWADKIAAGGRWLDRAARRLGPGWTRAEPLLYGLYAGVCVLWTACLFYGSMRQQTLFAMLWQDPARYQQVLSQGLRGEWSAPLDDVFIHFDFAQNVARGRPFEWSVGNGYTSGGTSLLYPFVLAVGYRLGWHGLSLMVWAAVLACVCVFGLMLAARRMFSGLPRWTSYVVPLCVLGVGGLDWSLFSGMEVALLLGLWALALVLWDDLTRPDVPARGSARRSVPLGLACAAIVATRPEGVVAVMAFSVTAAGILARRGGARQALFVLLGAVVPTLFVLAVQATANYLLTGQASAAGALAKLELYNPRLTRREVWDAWLFYMGYQVARLTTFHFAENPYWGWIVYCVAPLGFIFQTTRRYAVLLWITVVLWVAIIATNGQVRWQNERYLMPAVAWIMLAAAVGLAALFGLPVTRGPKRKVAMAVQRGLGLVAMIAFAHFQRPRFAQQVWFFGRASRNIYEQHVTLGRRLAHELRPTPRRVLLGDAGAIPYMSGLPALDFVGLGGYHTLPFAEASRVSVSASIELLEHVRPEDRPDVIAVYPSWWGDLPLWFGARRITQAYARGNVICGGWWKVVYLADWSPLDPSPLPFSVRSGELVVDDLDIADLLSERQHEFRLLNSPRQRAEMKMLPDPRNPQVDLWDAGRYLGPGEAFTFELTGFDASLPARLVLRSAPSEPARLDIFVEDQPSGKLILERHESWLESEIPFSVPRTDRPIRVRIENKWGFSVLYHLWAVQPGP
ncbi:MAG: hypothetical protein JW940_27745 [Polyangiaceae bacterium]|nr:hypothetical protein [Polyangiaceae bacterium]